MLRWFPRLQVATACFSCSPPDLNFLDPYFIFMYMHYNHCHRATAHLQLIIIIIIIIIICGHTTTYQLTAALRVTVSADHTHGHTTLVRTSMDKEIDPPQGRQTILTRQISMPPAGCELAVPGSERPRVYA